MIITIITLAAILAILVNLTLLLAILVNILRGIAIAIIVAVGVAIVATVDTGLQMSRQMRHCLANIQYLFILFFLFLNSEIRNEWCQSDRRLDTFNARTAE